VEEAEAQGAVVPAMTPEQLGAAGSDWHVFPNQVILPSQVAVLGYRARPNGRDPHSCIWDVYSLSRYAPGKEPKVELQWNDDLTDVDFWARSSFRTTRTWGMFSAGCGGAASGARAPIPSRKWPSPTSTVHCMIPLQMVQSRADRRKQPALPQNKELIDVACSGHS